MLQSTAAEASAQFLQRRSFSGTGHSSKQIITVLRLKQGSDDPGLIPTALLVGKGLEFRGDRFKNPLLVFHGFNRVQLPIDHFLRRKPRIFRQSSQIAQFRYFRNRVFQRLKINPPEIPVQSFRQNFIQSQDRFTFIKLRQRLPDHLYS